MEQTKFNPLFILRDPLLCWSNSDWHSQFTHFSKYSVRDLKNSSGIYIVSGAFL